jgi:hypothetical protein
MPCDTCAWHSSGVQHSSYGALFVHLLAGDSSQHALSAVCTVLGTAAACSMIYMVLEHLLASDSSQRALVSAV